LKAYDENVQVTQFNYNQENIYLKEINNYFVNKNEKYIKNFSYLARNVHIPVLKTQRNGIN